MLKGPRKYYTRPRRRRTRHLVKKALQKDKTNLVATTPEKAEGARSKQHSPSQADQETPVRVLEKEPPKTRSCNVKLHHLDTDETVLVLSSKQRNTVLYRHSDTCSYIVRDFATRGRKARKSSMNTKHNGDSQRSKTGISSAYQDERQSVPHPVAKRQIAKKSTTQLVRDFHPNRSNYPNSIRDPGRVPEKRHRLSDTYTSHAQSGLSPYERGQSPYERGQSPYERGRDLSVVNGVERSRSRSRDRDYLQGDPTRSSEKYFQPSRSLGNQRYDLTGSRESFGRYDERRDLGYQSTRPFQQSDPDSIYQRSAYGRGNYNRREYSRRDQGYGPRQSDNYLGNQGASHRDRRVDKTSAKPASYTKDSTPTNANKGIGKTLPPNVSYPNRSGVSKEVQSSDKKRLDKDKELATKTSATSATANIQPESQLVTSAVVDEKQKGQLAANSVYKNSASLSSMVDSNSTPKTSTSNIKGASCSIASEIIGKVPNPDRSKEKISSKTETCESPAAKPASTSPINIDSGLPTKEKTESLDDGGIANSNTEKPGSAPGNGSCSSKDPVKSLTEKADANHSTALAVLKKSKEPCEILNLGNNEDTCEQDDISSCAGVPSEGNKESSSSVKGAEDQLDVGTPEECASSPARPVFSAKQTTENTEKSSLCEKATASRSPSPEEISPGKSSRSPSPQVKQDITESSLNLFSRQGRQKLKSIFNKAFPKANLSVAKDDTTFKNKSGPPSPKATGTNNEVDSASLNSDLSKTPAVSPWEVKDDSMIFAKDNHSDSAALDSVPTSSKEPMTSASVTCTAVETSTTSKHVSDISNIRISHIEGGVFVPKPAQDIDLKEQPVNGTAQHVKETCGPSSTRNPPTSSVHDQCADKTLESNATTNTSDQLLLPGARESLDDRTNPDNAFEQSKLSLQHEEKMEQDSSPVIKTVVIDESIPASGVADPLGVKDVEPMEVSSASPQMQGGLDESEKPAGYIESEASTDHTNIESTQEQTQDSTEPGCNSVKSLKIISEVSLKEVSESGKSASECLADSGHSLPTRVTSPTDSAPSTNSTSAIIPVPVESASLADPEGCGKTVTESADDAAMESRDAYTEGVSAKAEAQVPKESLSEFPLPTDVKNGMTGTRCGKRGRSSSLDDTETRVLEDAINKKPKLVDTSTDGQKADTKSQKEGIGKDVKTTLESMICQIDKRDCGPNNFDQQVNAAAPVVIETTAKSNTTVKESCVQAEVELPVPGAPEVSSRCQTTVPIKTSPSPVPLASEPTTAPIPSPKSVSPQPKPKEESTLTSGHHTVKGEPSKTKIATSGRRSSTTPSPVPTPLQGPVRSSQRDNKPKQISKRDLRLLIERNAEAALQSRMKLLHRQLEVSSKGEQAWKERALELQEQLKAVHGELTKTKEEKDGFEADSSKLREDVEVLVKKLQDKGIDTEKVSVETQYDCKDFTEDQMASDLKSAEVTPHMEPQTPKVAPDKSEIPNTRFLRSMSKNQAEPTDKSSGAEPTTSSSVTAVWSTGASTDDSTSQLPQVTTKDTNPVSVKESVPESVPESLLSAVGLKATPSSPPIKVPSQGESLSAEGVPVLKAITPALVETVTSAAVAPAKNAIAPATIEVVESACSPAGPAKAPSPTMLDAGTAAPTTKAPVAVGEPKNTPAHEPSTNEEVASIASACATPKKLSTPEVQDNSGPAQAINVPQKGPLPRAQTPQSPQTASPRAQTPSSRAQTPASPRVGTPSRGQAVTPPKTTVQKPSVQAKMHMAVQLPKAQKATSSPQTNAKATPELECIDLTDDSEEPKSSEITSPSPSKRASDAAVSTGVASRVKMPPPYPGLGQVTKSQNAASSNTQGVQTKRPTPQLQQQQQPPVGQLQMRPRTHASVQQQQQQQQQQKPPGMTVQPVARPSGYSFPNPNQRPPVSAIPPVPALKSVSNGLQAVVSTSLMNSQLGTPNTKSQPVISNMQKCVNGNMRMQVASAGQAPMRSVVSTQQQQISSLPHLLQGMGIPQMFSPTAAQVGRPTATLTPNQGGRMQPVTATAVQLPFLQQQHQLQQAQKQQQQQMPQALQPQQVQQQLQQALQVQQLQQASQPQAIQLQQLQQQQQQQQQVQQLQQLQQAHQLHQQHRMQQQQQLQQHKLIQQQQAQHQQQTQHQTQHQQQQQQIQQQLMQQRVQQQQKSMAAKEQQHNVTVQHQLQLQRQQQQANQATQELVQQQNQKLHSQQMQKQRTLLHQANQEVQTSVLALKKQLGSLDKESLTLQAKAQAKNNTTYQQREYEMQQRHIKAKRKQIQDQINTFQQQHRQNYERLMAMQPNAAMNANPTPATKPSHPAPLPSLPPPTSNPPPKPELNISKVENGIVLSWNMTLDATTPQIEVYHLHAYQESEAPPNTSLWKKIGEVRALPLPMACTLTMFQPGSIYHFAVCAVDGNGQAGPFSDPSSINLPRNETSAPLG